LYSRKSTSLHGVYNSGPVNDKDWFRKLVEGKREKKDEMKARVMGATDSEGFGCRDGTSGQKGMSASHCQLIKRV